MKRISLKNIIILQLIVIIHTISQVMLKMASKYEFMSLEFIFFYAMMFLALFIYALCWQQMIKRLDLSIAYANRAAAILWALLWSALIFNEPITKYKVLGVLVVLIGVMVINTGKEG